MTLASGLTAQKPAIDLISSHRQYKHPEAIIDTGYAATPLLREGFLTPTPAIQSPNQRNEPEKKKRRQIGPSLDSIFQKEETKNPPEEKEPVNNSLFSHRFNPIKIIIYITALK